MVSKGDIVLVQFPFSDLSQTKLRPAVILWVNPTGNDVTLCAITSQNINQLSPEDIPLLPSDPEFSNTGLRVPSKIRTTRMATLTKQLVVKKLGNLGIQQTQRLNEKITEMLRLM
jgi:mRNA interferase MazF